MFNFLSSLFKSDTSSVSHETFLRDALEEYIDIPENLTLNSELIHERALLSNILSLRDINVSEVMVPRADIISIDVNASQEELFSLIAANQVSRLPVYKDTLDDVIGTIHLKDILGCIAKGTPFVIGENITEIPIVSPAMPILDLLLTMRQSRRHMALVVDEYGGIDGLLTIGDIVESIFGEIEDEHDTQEEPKFIENKDGSVLADARLHIDDFEDRYGTILNEEERDENDTLGGLVFTLAGRIPVRGEVLTHNSGMEFEIIEATPRHISVVRIRNIPELAAAE